MKIFSCKSTHYHGPDSLIEGPYRIKNFVDTVTNSELETLFIIAEKYLKLVHPASYIQKIKGACKSKTELAEVKLTPNSLRAIIDSVSLAILAVQKNGFAVTRPPGHHASKNKAEGFCFFNNIAVGTAFLLEQKKRVCIIDIDGHHGNGTEAIYRDNESVMLCSIYQDGAYPYIKNLSKISDRIISFPVPEMSGDDIFLKALEFFRPYIIKFKPDSLAISVGVDGYYKDRLLNLNYSNASYYEAGKYSASFDKPVFAVLEGGYHEDVKECVEAFVAGISGKKINYAEDLHASSPDKHMYITLTIEKLKKLLA